MHSESESEKPKNGLCCVIFSIAAFCVAVMAVIFYIIFTTPSSLQTVKTVKEIIKIDGTTRMTKVIPIEKPAFETLIIPTTTTPITTTLPITTKINNSTKTTELITSVPLTTTSTTINRNSDSPCRNGGIYIYETKRCICKDNISGEYCEEGN
jgi:hypothetical protein